MIAKKYRLREYEVSRVFKKGRPYFWTYWTMNCLEVRNSKHHRMAVSISRKHDKRAVQRNRYRRGLYDWLLPILKFWVSSLKHNAPIDPIQNSPREPQGMNLSNTKLKTQNFFQCVFTLKKGLKIPERKIPTEWIDDAQKLLWKITS